MRLSIINHHPNPTIQIKLIQNLHKGNVYIGCECGHYRTNQALQIDYVFNPKMTHSIPGIQIPVSVIKNLYHNLTDSDKLKMGRTKEFEKTFLKRLGELKK